MHQICLVSFWRLKRFHFHQSACLHGEPRRGGGLMSRIFGGSTGEWFGKGYGWPCSLLEMENKLTQGKSIKASGDSNKQLVKANWKYEVSKDSRFQWNIHLLYQPNVCKSSMLPISPTFPKTAPFFAKWHMSSQLWVHMLLQVLLEPALLDLRYIFRIGGVHVSHEKSPLTFY